MRGEPAVDAVRRFNAAFDAKDVDAIMRAMTADCVFEDTAAPSGQRHVGAAAVREAWERLFAGSPGAQFSTEEVIEAGDRVVVLWHYRYTGGHVRGVDVFTVRDGLVAEKRAYVKG
jgi:ketosteroid isomerase-like protein